MNYSFGHVFIDHDITCTPLLRLSTMYESNIRMNYLFVMCISITYSFENLCLGLSIIFEENLDGNYTLIVC
jgi:hypothetical protein